MVCSPGPGVTVTLLPSMLSEAQKPESLVNSGRVMKKLKHISYLCSHSRVLSYPPLPVTPVAFREQDAVWC